MTNPDIFKLETEAQTSLDAAPAALESTVDFLKQIVEVARYSKKLEYILSELPVVYEQELRGMTAFFTAEGQARYGEHAATGALGNALRALCRETGVEKP